MGCNSSTGTNTKDGGNEPTTKTTDEPVSKGSTDQTEETGNCNASKSSRIQ